MAEKQASRVAYGEELVAQGRINEKIVVCDADLSQSTMTCKFAKEFPDRFFNFGIAEANMVCAAAGMAHSGLIPFVSTFAIFGSARAYEQIRNSVAYTGIPVKFVLTHAGLSVGEDGGSHQTIEDIALFRTLPNMTIFVPADAIETKKMVRAAIDIDGPVYIRASRPVMPCVTEEDTPFDPYKAAVLREGSDIAIFTCGLIIDESLKAAERLAQEGIQACVVNFHTIKPFDNETAVEIANKCGAVITAEEHSIIGGLGSAVAEALAGHSSAKFARVGIQDKFGCSGTPARLFHEYGIDADGIVAACKKLLAE